MKTNRHSSRSRTLTIAVFTAWFVCFQLILAHASILSWSGGGASGNWNDSGNWGFVGTPANGDTLLFVTGQPRPVNTNNISNLTLNQIRFIGAGGGYSIFGNSFTITNSIQATNTSGANTINNDMVLATVDVTVNVSSSLSLNGMLSGSVGLTMAGAGTLTFSGNPANTYVGTTRVTGGVLVLNRNGFDNAVVGPVIIGTGSGSATLQLAQSSEVGNSVPVTVNAGGTFDLNNRSDGIGSLDMAGGTVNSGIATLSVTNGSTFSVSAGSSSVISGNFNIGNTTCTWTQAPFAFISISANVSGAATIIDNGMGEVFLGGSNSFTGTLTVNGGFIAVGNAWSLGTTNAGTIINEPGTIGVYGGNGSVNVSGEPLTLNSSIGYTSTYGGMYGYGGNSNSWSGPITLGKDVTIGADSSCTLNLAGAIGGGSFGVTKTFAGTVYYSGTNANLYTGTTVVSGGTLVLNKGAFNGAVAGDLVVSGTLRLNSSEQIADGADVLVNGGGLFDFGSQFEGFNTLHGSGNVSLGTSGYLNVGAAGGSSTFNGVISGTGFPGGYTVGKMGGGTFILGGDNTYLNGTAVFGGKLVINGSQPQSPIIDVEPGTTLAGSGVVGNIFANGTISPGNSPGILTSSNLVLNGTAVVAIELNGSIPGLGYDQLNVRGTNNLGGATLSLTTGGGFAPIEGLPLTILNNDGIDGIVGTFAGLPEGSLITLGAFKFRISYAGGSGNDVTLTLTNPPVRAVAGSVSAGNGNSVIDPAECNNVFLAISNTTAAPLTGISATLSTLTPGVVIPQFTVPYPDVPAGGKATNSLPFQLTTQPWFVAGTNINLMLSVSSSAGSFSTFFTLPTGSSGTSVRSNNTTPLAIPDLSTNFSYISMSGFTSAVAQVTVSFYISHTFDADLDVYLIAPDGTPVELTTDNGGSSDNYGISCTDGARTVFDDSAPTSITQGNAPFVGTFRPEQPLSTLHGVNPNGVWTLEVIDDTSGDVGTLNCWSLSISPVTSTDGGGACELCPNVTVASAIGLGNPTEIDRLTRNGFPTACGAPTICPGGVGTDSPYYDTYTFRNGPSNACVSVVLTSSVADVFSAAYLGSYDPSDLCSNYLADAGDSTLEVGGGTVSYSFNVASNAVFTVEVNNIYGSTGAYQLSVTGGDCRPVLNIKPASTNVVVNWTTAASGYQLERTNSLPSGTNWGLVTDIPTVISGRYQITNGVPGTSSEFYRLRKSLP